MIVNKGRKIKQHFLEVIQVKKSPHSIALGFAVGTFLAILPTPGFSILLGLLIVLIYPKLNKFSLFGAFVVWNPLLTAPIYTLSYTIGNYLFTTTPVVEYELVVWHHVYNFTSRILFGSITLGILFSLVSYGLVRTVAQKYQEKNKK